MAKVTIVDVCTSMSRRCRQVEQWQWQTNPLFNPKVKKKLWAFSLLWAGKTAPALLWEFMTSEARALPLGLSARPPPGYPRPHVQLRADLNTTVTHYRLLGHKWYYKKGLGLAVQYIHFSINLCNTIHNIITVTSSYLFVCKHRWRITLAMS